MTGGADESKALDTLVGLSGPLVRGDDVLDLLELLVEQCVELFDVASAGLLLADQREVLHVMAASSTATRDIEVLQVQRGEGPCQDCYLQGEPVIVEDLSEHIRRWPHFAPAALQAGFVSVQALPLRLQSRTLGALGLFGTSAGRLADRDLSLAQALADVASLGLTQNPAGNRAAVDLQLQTALTSRVLLEQAKGMLAHHGGLSMDQASQVLRRFTRDRDLRLSEVAEAVVTRTIAAAAVLEGVRAGRD